MQEEVTGKTVTLIVNGAKMSEQVFEKAVKKFLEEIQKSRQPKIYRGKQTLKQLASQNAGLANIEISDKNIKAFTHVAKKYPETTNYTYHGKAQSQILCKLPTRREQIRIQCVRQRIYPTAALCAV